MSDVEAKLRALAARYYVEPGDDRDNDPEPDMTLARAAAALAYEEAREAMQDRDCEADWDNGEACPDDLEEQECCTPCLVERRLRARAASLLGER